MSTPKLPVWPFPPPQAEGVLSSVALPASDHEGLAPAARGWILEDPISQELLKTIEQVAPSDAGVLILGESGADKEIVARHLHTLSPRRNGPFITVNCGALSDNLINAELFGHESGAFTGAFGNLPGRFEDAHLGTLFLDEIDDLPLHMQSKLVRVLEEKTVTRLGASTRTAVDVRVLAASSRALDKSVAARRFREDLYYLLGVVTLHVPPLRQRPGDILPLARHFIRSWCQRLHYAPVELNAKAQEKLLAHSWPGNSRELENVIHRTLLLSQGLHIGPQDLSISVAEPAPPRSGPSDARQEAEAASQLALDEALDALCDLHAEGLEQKVLNALLLKVWQRNRCNQVHTAKQLGISRSVVRARLVRLGQLSRQSAADDGDALAEPALPAPSQLAAPPGDSSQADRAAAGALVATVDAPRTTNPFPGDPTI